MFEQRVSDKRRGLDGWREIGNGSSGIHAFHRASLSVNIGDCIQNTFWQLLLSFSKKREPEARFDSTGGGVAWRRRRRRRRRSVA